MAKDKVQHQAHGDASDGDSVDSLSSWLDEDEIEMSQTMSEDDILMPIQEDDTDGTEIHEDEQDESVVNEADPELKQLGSSTNNA